MATNVIAYDNLEISAFELKYLKELKITNSINNHSKLELVGLLPEDKGETYIYSTEENTPIEVHYKDDKGNKNSIFNGIISSVKVKANKDVYYLYVEAYSFTYLMDVVKKSCSFQNVNMTSHELVKSVIGLYSNADVVMNIPNVPIGEFILQYKETDWEFIRRIISKYNQGLFSEIQTPNIKLFCGVPENLEQQDLEINSYNVYKEIDTYEEMKKNYLLDANETDYIIYEVQSHKILKLGSSINFKNSSFYVSSLCNELKQGILCNKYKLQNKRGLRQNRLFNQEVIGISLDGQIIGVKRDKVQVSLKIDEGRDPGNAYWFPYSTIAGSPDGGGWYCMPEISEKIRVNCPTKDEKRAFVINAIATHSADKPDENDRMSNPDNKSLKTDSGQEVKFTPNGVLIECNGGQARVNLNNDGTIDVIGQKNINLACAKGLSLRAENQLSISAVNGIDILCESGSNMIMTEGDEILLNGTRVHNNG
ncbi:hypothetical protein LL033_23555 [Clostridium estertheticum]|uniref:hypothetical protein n=1 Tax=Clostridium estertheticum TaxID=238834 RepID=UPI001C0C8BE3|nr:hypothetical protein [Clostridium estertheticum]MBU3215190.1 hypothetical protein [Clostridium estertheticum]WAG55523.1 hypothetical protein LL033_23555 [Clostridium estertheticum]